MKMTGAVLWALLVAGSASAQQGAPPAPPPGDHPAPDANAPNSEQFQKRSRLMRTLAIADALELDDTATLKLRDRLSVFELKREPLHRQMVDATAVLRRAAKGDTTAYAQVDGAIQQILSLREKLDQLDRGLFAELSAGLSPAKKARLALAMARLPQQMREMAQDKGRR